MYSYHWQYPGSIGTRKGGRLQPRERRAMKDAPRTNSAETPILVRRGCKQVAFYGCTKFVEHAKV
eukprot:3178964-Rhodomonas_salina.1